MIEFTNVKRAQERLKGMIRETPLVPSTFLSERSGFEVYLKLENFQVTGSFKVRGVLNRMLKTPVSDKEKGVITATSGNHGKALAYAAKLDNVPEVPLATVVAAELSRTTWLPSDRAMSVGSPATSLRFMVNVSS